MKWNIKIVYRMLYVFMSILCAGGLVYTALSENKEIIEKEKLLKLWSDFSFVEQLGWLLGVFCAAGCIFMLFYLCSGYRPLKLLIAFAVAGYIGYCFVTNLAVADFVIIIAVVLILQGLLEFLVKDAIYTLPIVLIFGVLLTFCPIKEEPLQWTWVKQIYNAVKVLASEMSAKLDYYRDEEDSVAAFSEAPSFGGSIKDNEMEQLCLVGDGKETGMYLSGRVYNIYTEEGWENRITPDTYNENGWNYVQLLSFLKNANVEEEWVRSLCKRRTYTIMYRTIYTETAFTYLHTISYDAGDERYEYRNGSAIFGEPKDKGFQYDITYIDINYGSEMLQDMWKQMDVTELPVYSYEELRQYSMEYFNIDLSEVISEEEYKHPVQSWQDVITENYLDIPEHVPERVKLLAEEITKDCDSDYEKVSAIAEYLHSFQYNTNPMDIDGECVIDSFLFDAKEGYCTHFASAMVLLCRSVDIPARYVSGFYLGEADKSESDTYHANGNDAHAWAECYMEGYGFLPVEATPGYYSSTMQQWSQNEMDLEVMDKIIEEQLVEESAEEAEQEQALRKKTIFVVAGSVFVVVLMIFLSGGIWLIWCYRVYRSMEVAKQCRLLWYLQLQLLTKVGMGIMQGETLREYDNRVRIEEISKTLVLYEKLKYGKMVCDVKEKAIFYASLIYCKKLVKGGNLWLLWYFPVSIVQFRKI